MSYPAIGKVKTIVLPYFAGTKTIKEYKEAFGIDLTEILEFEDRGSNVFRFKVKDKFKHSLFLGVQEDDSYGMGMQVLQLYWMKAYESGVSEGIFNITYYDQEEQTQGGLYLYISKDSELSWDNVEVIGLTF